MLVLCRFADAEELLSAWQAGTRPEDVKRCLLAGQQVCGAPGCLQP